MRVVEVAADTRPVCACRASTPPSRAGSVHILVLALKGGECHLPLPALEGGVAARMR